jgi:hypothetical protein
VSDNLFSDRFGDLLLHPKHLNDYSEYADLSDGLLRLVLPLEHLVELLEVVKLREALVACLPQQVVKGGQGLQVLWQVIMWSTLPWVGVSITEERIHQYRYHMQSSFVYRTSTTSDSSNKTNEIIYDLLFDHLLVEVLHPDGYNAGLASEHAECFDCSHLQLGMSAALALDHQGDQWDEYLEDDGLDAELPVKG